MLWKRSNSNWIKLVPENYLVLSFLFGNYACPGCHWRFYAGNWHAPGPKLVQQRMPTFDRVALRPLSLSGITDYSAPGFLSDFRYICIPRSKRFQKENKFPHNMFLFKSYFSLLKFTFFSVNPVLFYNETHVNCLNICWSRLFPWP